MPAAPRPADRGLRVLRGCLLAGTSTALTVAAHSAAGGGVPDLGLFLVPTMLLAGAGTLLAERARGRGVMVAYLGGTQLAVHGLLSMNATSHEMLLAGRAVTGPLPMTVGHVLATAVLALILTRADAVLATVADALSAALPRPIPALPAWAPVAAPVATHRQSTELIVLLRRVRSRRGPPSDS